MCGDPKVFPSYLDLDRDELSKRAAGLIELMRECRLCPRSCRSRRLAGRMGSCETGRLAEVASWCIHSGEEPCISGTSGSGTVFFAHCNLNCVFCQNYQISQEWPPGSGVKSAEELAAIYLELQEMGAHNINWVSPSHVVAQAVEALEIAAGKGLKIPVVYNSNGYDSLEALRLLHGIVDIYMPDLKYADESVADELSKAVGYVPSAQAAVAEMASQVGPLQLDDSGVARRGLLVRHLVLPNRLSQTDEVLNFLAKNLGRETAVSLMSQYHPSHAADEHPLLWRRISQKEYARALDALDKSGLTEGYTQGLSSPESYLPDFNADGHPFEKG